MYIIFCTIFVKIIVLSYKMLKTSFWWTVLPPYSHSVVYLSMRFSTKFYMYYFEMDFIALRIDYLTCIQKLVPKHWVLFLPYLCQYHSFYHVFTLLSALKRSHWNNSSISLSIIEPRHEKIGFSHPWEKKGADQCHGNREADQRLFVFTTRCLNTG